MDSGLKNRVAIVAASSQGIGRATAEAFAAEGCRVAMCARNAERLREAAEQIRRRHNAEVLATPFDVTDPGAVRTFVDETLSMFGSVDICVTNAGGPPAKGFLSATSDDWRKAIDANFLSAVYFV
jgi:3-oxoacyl-[acyl-carrier protein] reductase